MFVETTEIPGLLRIMPRVFRDDRGEFFESWNERTFRESGIGERFVQDNSSRSKQGVLRGLHYQIQQPQGKLVRVGRGRIFDAVVDLRRSSPAFGRHVTFELSDENRQMIFVPPGCAHGFLVLSDTADVDYRCTDFYAPAFERSLLWNDPTLGIEWPIRSEPLLSDKDRLGVPFPQAECYV